MVTKGHRATGSTFRLNGGRKEVQTHVQKHERVDQMRGEIDYRSLPLNIRFPFKSGARLNACYDPSRRIYMCVRWELKGECCGQQKANFSVLARRTALSGGLLNY